MSRAVWFVIIWSLLWGCLSEKDPLTQGKSYFQPNPALPTPAPVIFAAPEVLATVEQPVRLTWGPDGRLYVGGLDGKVTAFTFDDTYEIAQVAVYDVISHLSNPHILGLAFNPFESGRGLRLYVAHSRLFENEGSCDPVFSSYSGQVSILEGPLFATLQPVVTGLPVSNHDHGVNGLEFDQDGNLLILQGGNTNAGVPSCPLGHLPESPLSAAVLRVSAEKLKRLPLHLSYVESASGLPNDNAVMGAGVDLAQPDLIEIYATGLRNPFDLVWLTDETLFATDNGPNPQYGEASIGPDLEIPLLMESPDELLHLVKDHYFGHPNRNRGRSDSRENIYFSALDQPVLGTYTPPLAMYPGSTNGIDEYRATTFGGALRGAIIAQNLYNETFRMQRDENGIFQVSPLSIDLGIMRGGVDLIAAPKGVLLITDLFQNRIMRIRPHHSSGEPGMKALDIFPWRAPTQGKRTFEMGGYGFGGLPETRVFFGTEEAILTAVSAERIQGFLPNPVEPEAALLDVRVESHEEVSILPSAFRYLLAPGEGKGKWMQLSIAPFALAENAPAVVNGILYLVGRNEEHVGATLALDLSTGTWHERTGQRPFPGNHSGVEVVDGKIYVIGGIQFHSDGKVQIYDPKLDQWTMGADMPLPLASMATAVIHGKIYCAGGLIGNDHEVRDTFVYDPKSNAWNVLTPMPAGRFHAAGGTDGRFLYVFGGRSGPHQLSAGHDDVQIFDPESNQWSWSGDPKAGIPFLPKRRSGVGKAPYLQGEFYFIGGETSDTDAELVNQCYKRVDVYNPVTRAWRREKDMLVQRHGILPFSHDGRIYVVSGNAAAGDAERTAALEEFIR